MLFTISLLALVAPLVSGLTLDTPANATSGGPITIKWTSGDGDPSTFSFELVNTVFNNAFAIANNVDPTTGELTLSLPIVPAGDGYTLEAVNISNINDVIATSGGFSVAETVTTTSATFSSTSASSSGSHSSSAGTSVKTTTTTSAFGVTVVPSSTQTTASGSSTGSAASSASSSSASTGFSNAASRHSKLALGVNAGSVAAVFLATVVGAAVIVL